MGAIVSMFASVVLDGVLEPSCLAYHLSVLALVWWYICSSESNVMRLRPFKGQLKKAYPGLETETRELLEGMEENSVSPTRSGGICSSGKSIISLPIWPP